MDNFLEESFKDECGFYANDYPSLNHLGEMKFHFYTPLAITLLVTTIIFFILAYGKIKKNGKDVQLKESTRTIYKVLAWISLILFIPASGMTIYKYIIYLTQYGEWIKKLSAECRLRLSSIKTINTFSKID